MTVSLRLALTCVIGMAVTGCGAAPDTEGRLKELEAKLDAQSLLLDDLTCQVSQTDSDMLRFHFTAIRDQIEAQDRWNQVAPPGLEHTVKPIREYAAEQVKYMTDLKGYMKERHDYRKIDEILARRKWEPLAEVILFPYHPLPNRNAEK